MSEIADAAGISKSLLFHYFTNKKELYLFLLENCAEITVKELTQSGCYEQTELFESMYRGLQAKMRIMKQYPDIGAFVIKAFYEKDPSVCGETQTIISKYFAYKKHATLLNFNPEQFVPGIDIKAMYQDMYWASEGTFGKSCNKAKLMWIRWNGNLHK